MLRPLPNMTLDLRPHCVFRILNPWATGNQLFAPASHTRDVVAWIRHAVSLACADWKDAAAFVHGHDVDGQPLSGKDADFRFQYLPLPGIHPRWNRVDAIARVMIVAPHGCKHRIDFIRQKLLGQPLQYRDHVHGLLNLQPKMDWLTKQYLLPARVWSSVTPVVLPGYDDHSASKIQQLIQKACVMGGIPAEMMGEGFRLTWQEMGFRPGVAPSYRFARPDHVTGRLLHVKLQFAQPIIGPIVLGAGRYRGFGIFARDLVEQRTC